MTFSSAAFLFVFLPLTVILYHCLPGIRAKNLLLSIVSVLFYAFGEPIYVLLLLLSVLVNYFLVLRMAAKREKWVLVTDLLFNFLLLGVFKYAGLFVEGLNLLPLVELPVPRIALPIGISFFTFQIVSYVIDVWRGETAAQRRFSDLLLYIALFPQLIAGPIVKYHDIDEQIQNRTVTAAGTAAGIRRFLIGLSKKLLLSNVCALLADAAFNAGTPGTALAWLGAFAYCLQIYHDFSGYSDMAIGLCAMFGFTIPENFNYPYISGSVKEFWRRWHISLSSWFREYLYIPLGGNRRGRARMFLNKLIVFFTTGLWHGASLNFILWGLWHGAFLILEDVLRPTEKKLLRPIWRVVTLLCVLFGFVLFRADNMAAAWDYLASMFTASPSGLALASVLTPYNAVILLFSAVLSCPILPALKRRLGGCTAAIEKTADVLGYAAAAVLFFACAVTLASSTFNPFIYFRF